jgi:hypothetical protein
MSIWDFRLEMQVRHFTGYQVLMFAREWQEFRDWRDRKIFL